MAKRVSVINFKGGVGKTTLSYQFAAGLARYHGARVLMVDLDHQSSLSLVALGAANWQGMVGAGRTVGEIFKPFVFGTRFPGAELVEPRAVKAPLVGHNYPGLDIVPASLELDDIEINLTSSHQGDAVNSEWSKRTLLCRWIEEAGIDAAYDYVIFDCPPATKIMSQNAIAASHGFIVPVIPEAVMERGAPHLVNMIATGIDTTLQRLAALGQPRRPAHVPVTQLVGLVVTRLQTHGPAQSGYTDDHTRHLGSLARSWGNDLLQPYVNQGTGVSQALDDGVPVYDRGDTQNIGGRGIDVAYRQLTDVLKQRVDML